MQPFKIGREFKTNQGHDAMQLDFIPSSIGSVLFEKTSTQGVSYYAIGSVEDEEGALFTANYSLGHMQNAPGIEVQVLDTEGNPSELEDLEYEPVTDSKGQPIPNLQRVMNRTLRSEITNKEPRSFQLIATPNGEAIYTMLISGVKVEKGSLSRLRALKAQKAPKLAAPAE